MIAPLDRALVFSLLASAVLCQAQETNSDAHREGVAPLVSAADMIALAPKERERWVEPKGEWDFKSDSLTGSGDSRINFKGPFEAPFTLDFRLKVLKGMRPRVFLGPLTFANEGYERTLALYPSNRDGVPFSYEENREYAVSIAVERNGVLLSIDGKKCMTAGISIEAVPLIGFSGGDWWSKGATRFSDIVIRPRKAAIVAEVPAPEAKNPTVSAPAPGVAHLKEAYEKDVAALAEERKGAEVALRKEYAAELEAQAKKLREERRFAIAGALLAEKVRVEAGNPIVAEKFSTAPHEVIVARAAFLEKQASGLRQIDERISQRAASYLVALKDAADAAAGENAGPAKALYQAELVRLGQVLPPPPRELKRTNAGGGGGGGPFEEVGPGDSLLTGLVVHTGDFAGHNVLVAVQPIFRQPDGTKAKGAMRGQARGEGVTIEAKEGYAIGRLNMNSGDRVDGLEAMFMKIKPGGLALDPADTYVSPYLGGTDGGSTQIGGSGKPVVGIFGATGLELDSLGLIEWHPAAKTVDKAEPVKGVKEVTREKPGSVKVEGVRAEPLVESSNRELGKWQKVPEALRGATIHSAADDKHLGVAEFRVMNPGRVYLALNYEMQGNSSGGWTTERWQPEDFEKNGWARVEGMELRSWANRTFQIYTRELKAGETGRLRCNKYEPPYFITFQP